MTKDSGDKIKRLMREAVEVGPSNVTDFAAAARKRGRSVARPAPMMRISGSNNAGIIGNNNQVNITVKAPARQLVRVEVQRGPGDITEAQAAEVQELVAKIVTVSGKPFPFVWSKLKRKFRVSSYRLIPAEQFDAVRMYLRQWIASEAGQSDASMAEVRRRALGRIHAESKKAPGKIDLVKTYALDQFGVQSLGELTVEQLHEVIRQFKF